MGRQKQVNNYITTLSTHLLFTKTNRANRVIIYSCRSRELSLIVSATLSDVQLQYPSCRSRV